MTNPLIAARDAFAARHPERRADLNGRDWGYVDVGAGETLLLIPGTLGRADLFWQQIEALSGRLRLVAVSYPASGGIADWADDMVTLLDRLEIARASVLGSSLGGYLAQYLAGAHPDRVRRLLAANTLNSVAGLARRMPYSQDLDAAAIADLRAGFDASLSAWQQARPDQGDLVALLGAEAGGRILEGELRARLAALKTGPELPPVRLAAENIVTIESDDDPLIPPPMRDAVRARLAQSVSYRFGEGGHFPYVARPADYIALLEQAMGLKGSGVDWGEGAVRRL